jgi:hypothetical protein
VIVMVQLYCWVFTVIVFVGDGWLPLVRTCLPHLRRLYAVDCGIVLGQYEAGIEAAVPDVLITNPFKNYGRTEERRAGRCVQGD